MDQNIVAKLVYDQKNFNIPSDLLPTGHSREDALKLVADKGQLRGTVPEQVCELAGRTCYDSLSTGRNSEEYWQHIRQVKHLSVVEHANFVVELLLGSKSSDTSVLDIYKVLTNRRGVWVTPHYGTIRVCVNPRALIEWDQWSERLGFPLGDEKWLDEKRHDAQVLGLVLHRAVSKEMPMVLLHKVVPSLPPLFKLDLNYTANLVPPINNNERFVSLFLSGSRGFSHEQVRHRFGISQRSTRFCDESSSPWVTHPLMEKYIEETGDQFIINANRGAIEIARKHYDAIVEKLQPWLMSKGVDKLTARKQARGTARGFLGNALKTEMIFTASVNDWKIIISQRANDAADAEIRMLYEQVIDGLLKSQYADEFKGLELVPAKDGMGKALKV